MNVTMSMVHGQFMYGFTGEHFIDKVAMILDSLDSVPTSSYV